jgi:DNA-binding PadR family transcriptional regulator
MTESYKVQFYILGYLVRLGSQHGYQIKGRIEREAADFARIKLPNLYYHLGRMEEKGWVSSKPDREGNRPEREVYSISKAGRKAFAELRDRCLEEASVWEFAVDGALFFMDGDAIPACAEALSRRRARAEEGLRALAAHKEATLAEVPESFRDTARLIFEHHELHHRAELEWLGGAIASFTSISETRKQGGSSD